MSSSHLSTGMSFLRSPVNWGDKKTFSWKFSIWYLLKSLWWTPVEILFTSGYILTRGPLLPSYLFLSSPPPPYFFPVFEAEQNKVPTGFQTPIIQTIQIFHCWKVYDFSRHPPKKISFPRQIFQRRVCFSQAYWKFKSPVPFKRLIIDSFWPSIDSFYTNQFIKSWPYETHKLAEITSCTWERKRLGFTINLSRWLKKNLNLTHSEGFLHLNA